MADCAMKVLGITGGVGMGKSATADFLRQRGVRIVDTDAIARDLVTVEQPAWREIVAAFGAEIVDAQGALRREKLAAEVFANPGKRQQLEAILHPRIRHRWLEEVEQWRREGCPLAAVVIPLLFETHASDHFDKIICVACSSSTQRARLAARGWDDAHQTLRIQAQWPVAKKIERADYAIWTEGSLALHAEQAALILHRIGHPQVA